MPKRDPRADDRADAAAADEVDRVPGLLERLEGAHVRVALGSACPQREAELRAREVAADEADGHVVLRGTHARHGRHRRGRARGQRRLATALTPGSPQPAVRLSPAWPPGCRAARPPRLRRPPRRCDPPVASGGVARRRRAQRPRPRSCWTGAPGRAGRARRSRHHVRRARRPHRALADDVASMISGTRASTEAPTIRATDSPARAGARLPRRGLGQPAREDPAQVLEQRRELGDEGAEVLAAPARAGPSPPPPSRSPSAVRR